MSATRQLIYCLIAIMTIGCALSNAANAQDGAMRRGAYLVNGIVACGNCHANRGPDGTIAPGQELAGGTVIETPAFRAIAPNITPDPDTGIGKWTKAQLVAAIRDGRRPNGTIVGPPMPIEFYRHMSDTDVDAIATYLRSVKPVNHAVEKSTYKIPLPSSYGPPVTHVADVSPRVRLRYGHYLADIGHCVECHTPMEKGQLITSKFGAGGRELPAFPSGVVISANLTPANPDGIAKWTDAQVKETMRTGVRPDGRHLVRLMAFDWYKTIDDADLSALVAYLRTLPPAKP